MAKPPLKRCAIYTRKSSEEGLEQDFNSLHAQREACEAFIRSQQGEGWKLVPAPYDDGGISGGTMERPGLQRLLADIREQRIDVIVVYKVDRLTRSLADFAKMVETFDAHGVSFVAVTQQFNTTSSMGRLTLNILLSFAQFEREVTGERIRDKIAASKRKGIWMGGLVPLGYEVKDRKLLVNQAEAKTVRHVFSRYLDRGCVRRLKQELDKHRIRSKHRTSVQGRQSGNQSFSRGALYTLLRNPIYIGEIRHGDLRHPGQHTAIVEQSLWEQVQQKLQANTVAPNRRPRQSSPSPLLGKLFDEAGKPLTPSHAVKQGRRYRYYVSAPYPENPLEKRGWRLPAPAIEAAVSQALLDILKDDAGLAIDLKGKGGPAVIKLALQRAKDWVKRLESTEDAGPAVTALIRRVALNDQGFELTINLALLADGDAQPSTSSHGADDGMITRLIPAQMKRRGVEMRIVLERGGARRDPDLALLKAIARARSWFEELASGKVQSLREIAAREGLADQFIGNILPLAFLAPGIVETVIDGRQAISLSADELIYRTDLPPEWRLQERILAGK